MRSMSPRSVRSILAATLAAGVLGATLVSPVGAHVGGTPAHLYEDHLYNRIRGDFFTKQAANNKFVPLRSGSHMGQGGFTNVSAQVFSNLSGSPRNLGSVGVTVPPGQTWFAVVEFTAESACSGGTGGHWCVVAVVVDDGAVSVAPNAGGEFAFDSTDNGTETAYSWEGHTMKRTTGMLGPGSHTINFRGWVTSSAVEFWLDDIHVEASYYRCLECV